MYYEGDDGLRQLSGTVFMCTYSGLECPRIENRAMIDLYRISELRVGRYTQLNN